MRCRLAWDVWARCSGTRNSALSRNILTLAKGLGGGVPIGAFLAKEHACAFDPGDHGSTFGGNALTCAAAYASTKYIIDHGIAARARERGEYLEKGLTSLKRDHEFISDVRGNGSSVGGRIQLEHVARGGLRM